MRERLHYPNTARGRERRTGAGREPGRVAPSWPNLNRAPAPRTVARKAPKARHPDCATDRVPHRTLTRAWHRAGLTVEQAATEAANHGALGERALTVYRKMQEQLAP